MTDEQLLRYSRQLLLPEIDYSGQTKLSNAHVAIIGLGGLGSPAAMYLAAGGIGKLTLCDFDTVDLGNLQRQIAHTTNSIGEPKVESAKKTLAALNPDTKIETLQTMLNDQQLNQLFERVDVVIDATDNFPSRFSLNRAALATKTPVIVGAASRFRGQVTTIDPRNNQHPCYACLFPGASNETETCSTNGVIAPLVGVIGSMQAIECIKVILDIGALLRGRLWIHDALSGCSRIVPFSKDPECSACGKKDQEFSAIVAARGLEAQG